MKPGNHCTMYSKVPIPAKSKMWILTDEEEDSDSCELFPKGRVFLFVERREVEYTNVFSIFYENIRIYCCFFAKKNVHYLLEIKNAKEFV